LRIANYLVTLLL